MIEFIIIGICDWNSKSIVVFRTLMM